MLNCREVAELSSRELEEPLGTGERVSLSMHLMMCTGCRQYRRQLFRLHEAAGQFARGEAVPDRDDPHG